ncbi:MAG TPA: PilZ domain-containing protein, partial [Myxococcales bacterium]|nr:PilZ domain-containing protein [Myxococcales bacterium]
GQLSEAVAFDASPFEGEEHRQFPRARMAVRFEAWIGEGEDRRFQASFVSANVSVSGAFLESTFFLPIGTEIRVNFALEPGADPVQARAAIIREERPDARTGEGRSGFGIKFVEFFSQTEVTLAKLFLGAKLRAFAESYMTSRRARSLNNELDRVVDALAAWELQKVTTPGDPWHPLDET